MTVLRTSLRNFFAHKWRMALSGMAVVLSVSFVCGTLVFTATMNTTFDRLFAVTASNVMVTPDEEEEQPGQGANLGNGVPATVPASLADEISAVDGVGQVTGSVESTTAVAVDDENETLGPNDRAPTIVANWSDMELRSMEITEGAAPNGPDEILVDSGTAEDAGLALGDEIRLVTVSGDYPMTISGIAEFQVTNPGAVTLYVDLATAQEYLLGGQDAFTTLYVDSSGGISDQQLRADIADAVGTGGYQLQTADEYTEENRDETGQILDIVGYVVLGFAGVSLLVGIFLIVNTFSMLVAQRTREIGLMRAIGSSRRQMNRSVMIEAGMLGLFGSIVGFGVGIGLAIGLMRIMSAIGMELSLDDLTINATVPVTGIVLGLVVTLIAAYIPARRAARISPMAALRDAGMPGDARAGRVRAAIGAVLTVAGLAALAATAGAEEAAAGAGALALGVVLSLVGLVLLAPALVGLLVSGLSMVLLRIFGPVGRLAERNALRNPRRTGATASALMIGLALVAGLSVVGTSMVASATEEIDESLGADFMITTSNFTQILPSVIDAARDVEGLDHVTEWRELEAEITAPNGETFDHTLGAVDDSYLSDVSTDVSAGDLSDALAPGGISVDNDTAASRNLSVGDQVTVAFEDGDTAELTVAAITTASSSSLEGDSWFIGMDTARQSVPEADIPLPFTLFASAEDGQQDQARAGLERAMEPYPQMEIRDQAEIEELIQDQVGQLLNMVYGLLALAIIVAILGVINTLALSVVERTREIGLMRAIGLSRRQLRRMIRLESVVIALFGALLGLGLGMAWGAAGQQLLELEGMPILEIPWGTIIGVFIGSAVVGLLAALLPAFRAGRMNVLNAIATE